MGTSQQGDVTRILLAARDGDSDAARALLPVVYEELRRMARAYMAEKPGNTLQPTALVHEAFIRLVGDADPGWNGRRHFFGAAAMAMRQVLVDHARAKGSQKRGGGRRRVALEELSAPLLADPDALIALDEALQSLERSDPRKSKVVTLRFFAGMTAEQTAEILDLPLRTVERDWSYARAWLRVELMGETDS